MTEMIVHGNLLGATKSEEGDCTTTVEISVLDGFNDNLTTIQHEYEPAPELEKCDPLETVTQAHSCPKEPTPAPSVQSVEHGLPPESNVTASFSTEHTVTPKEESKPEWTVGASCQAVWSEDGKVYAATILSLEGDHCRVRFDGYGNEETVEVSSLRQPHGLSKTTHEWKAGSRCRATYTDGLIYPAVVLWVKEQRCRVRFDHYNNEDELDLSSLLRPDELHGAAHSGRSSTWRPMFGTGARRRREAHNSGDKQELEKDRGEKVERDRGERGERDRSERWKERPYQTWNRDKVVSHSREEKETEEKKPVQTPTFPTISFPPFPPSPLGDIPAFMHPPPPFGPLGGKDCMPPNSFSSQDPTSQLLMLWYMCGFHTGSYLTHQQNKFSSKD